MAFTVALPQIESFGMDQSRNLEKGLKCCRDAKSMGADLVVLWNIGFARCPIDATGRQFWTESAINRHSDFFRSFADSAKELDTNIAITYLEAHLPKPRNTAWRFHLMPPDDPQKALSTLMGNQTRCISIFEKASLPLPLRQAADGQHLKPRVTPRLFPPSLKSRRQLNAGCQISEMDAAQR
jgi:hypothetical protein